MLCNKQKNQFKLKWKKMVKQRKPGSIAITIANN